jgi:hypothetical protein
MRAPGSTPKTSATWPIPDWLPDLGPEWGAWECSGGDWHSEHLDGWLVRIGDPPAYEPVGRADAYVSGPSDEGLEFVEIGAAGIPALLDLMRRCGL